MYLIWAAPYRSPGDEPEMRAIRHVVDDQQAMCSRIVDLLLERNQRVSYGDFPITFTGSHDLSLSYLMQRVTKYQQGTVKAIEECCKALADDPLAQGLAEECLGMAKGHLETFEELVSPKPPQTVKLHEPEAAV